MATKIGNLMTGGPTGATGPTGPTGPAGVTGASGTPGSGGSGGISVWDETTAYDPGQFVIAGYGVYVAATSNTGIDPATDPVSWTPLGFLAAAAP